MWKRASSPEIDAGKVPMHIAIIMDGNGRWADKRGLPRTVGHRSGLESARVVIEEAASLGVRYLTLYMFSTENWTRPKAEVDFLMSLPGEFWRRERENLQKHDIRLFVLGDLTPLPVETREVLNQAVEETKGRTGMTVSLAINYGGRSEILRAALCYVRQLDPAQANPNEEDFSRFLYTCDMPDPDLLIRPGGEQRVSNYLLWQIAYTELVFVDTLWPDFSAVDLRKTILEYQRRERRRGGLKSR